MKSFSTGRVYNFAQVIEHKAHNQDGIDGIAFRDESRGIKGFIKIPSDSSDSQILSSYDNGNYTHLSNAWEVF